MMKTNGNDVACALCLIKGSVGWRHCNEHFHQVRNTCGGKKVIEGANRWESVDVLDFLTEIPFWPSTNGQYMLYKYI